MRNLLLRSGICVYRKMTDGKQHCRSTGFRHLAFAERRAMEVEIEVGKEGLGWTRPLVVTFKQWADRYARSYGLRNRSARRDRDILGHALPLWTKCPIDSITPSDCMTYMHRRENDGATARKIVREMGFLKALFDAAIATNLLRANPWAGITRPRTAPRSRVLATDEQTALDRGHAAPAAPGMGHHSPTVTMRNYMHVQENDLCRALRRVELGQPPAGPTRVVTTRQRGA